MKPKNILIIEDDVDVLTNIETLLKEENYEVVTATNGQIGIDQAKDFIPDLIICDILMPVANCYDVLRQLSNYKDRGSIPFIFLTAKVERNDIRLGMELGADDYLFKPFNSGELLNAIKSRLSKHEIIISDHIEEAQENQEQKKKRKYDLDEKLFITVNGKPIFLKISEIKCIITKDHYTILKLINGKCILMRRSIKSWEDSLPEKTFLRIHRCTIVNLDFIVKMEKWHNASTMIYLKDIIEPFIISKRYTAKIREKQM